MKILEERRDILKFDLHNHTYYSDGRLAPEQLVKLAKERGVTKFAITDHDSVLAHLFYEDEMIIKGIELSTYTNGQSVHLVGLFKNGYIPQTMIDFSHDFLAKRKVRAIEMMTKIQEIYGLKIDLAKLTENADKTSITRGNMLKNLCECNNLTEQEATKYISNSSKAYIPASKLDTKAGIDFLHNNNCLVILAHPTLLKPETFAILENYNFDGIEARYPKNKENEEEYFKEIARKKGWFISAGSDFHGDESHALIGTSTLALDEFNIILKRLES